MELTIKHQTLTEQREQVCWQWVVILWETEGVLLSVFAKYLKTSNQRGILIADEKHRG